MPSENLAYREVVLDLCEWAIERRADIPVRTFHDVVEALSEIGYTLLKPGSSVEAARTQLQDDLAAICKDLNVVREEVKAMWDAAEFIGCSRGTPADFRFELVHRERLRKQELQKAEARALRNTQFLEQIHAVLDGDSDNKLALIASVIAQWKYEA